MITSTLQIRRATPADKDEVIALSRAIDEHDYIAYGYDDWVKHTGPDGLYVALLEGRIVGCHSLEFHAPGQAYLFAMRIHPDMQGKGVGSSFCQLQVEHARSLGAQEIHLVSELNNERAHRTVMKNGFINRGAWLIYDRVTGLLPQPPARKARWARPEDQAEIARFRRQRGGTPLDGVIASRRDPWAVVTEKPGDWDLANTVLCEGESGLAGLMLLSQTEVDLLVRWLDGSPEVAADLLAFALTVQAERNLPYVGVSLPLAAEPLLAPLGLPEAEAFRGYVFHLPSTHS